MDKLTTKQKRFCEEYVKLGNATRAYQVAGYAVKSETSAASSANRMLRNVKVKSYIDGLMGDLKKSTIADADEALETITNIMRGNTTDEVVMMNPITGTVERVEKRVDKTVILKSAAEILKRHPLPVDINLNAPTKINIVASFDDVEIPEPEYE
ncbi:terminase small subunit [Leuconostoc fallax]|uniref:Terminase small subunit n=1 Tax=Leuconostoc fallax TaxID=1251 RepID=A0A4R5N8V9_9LACO|nr:terminase small subunit [Leuconostoc fallax]TDG68060.1 hypothetical protein C5L23_000366 [Leuconostoc fallax]